MPTSHGVHVTKAGGPFESVSREIPALRPRQVLVQVKACGVCHSDMFTKEGAWPGIKLPLSPGHEIAGVIEAVGSDVKRWKKGQRVGIGWTGGYCGDCEACRSGDFVNCEAIQVPGLQYDGGYQSYVVTTVEALAALPDALSFEEAAPILCAGITTFNALRHSGAHPGDLVAIQGIGGLGHFGIQFANRMGFNVAAISSGKDKEALAKKLGAHIYVDASAGDPAKTLAGLGGAKAILATAPSGKSISPLVNGLSRQGTLVVVGASMDPVQVATVQLIQGTKSIQGWPSGSPKDSEETLAFCALTGIRPMIETFPIAKATEAYDKMMTNKVRFRAVLVH